MIPAPIYFGRIFDSQCLVWSEDCEGNRGSCLEYDTINLPYALFGVCIGIQLLAVVTLYLTYFFSRRLKAGPISREEVHRNSCTPKDETASRGTSVSNGMGSTNDANRSESTHL